MMKIINKFAPLIVIGIIIYLTHFSLSKSASSAAASGKELPIITKKMLNPEFIEPQESASPVDRDPFTASWNIRSDSSAETKVGSVNIAEDSGNSAVSGELMGILSGDDGQRLALISGEVYGVGSSVRLLASGELWQISSISDESVVLTCNELQTVLKIANGFSDVNDVNNVSMDIFMTEGQKESVR
jgi:hypothetical protein